MANNDLFEVFLSPAKGSATPSELELDLCLSGVVGQRHRVRVTRGNNLSVHALKSGPHSNKLLQSN